MSLFSTFCLTCKNGPSKTVPQEPLTMFPSAASVTKVLMLLSALLLHHAYSLSQDSRLLPLLAWIFAGS